MIGGMSMSTSSESGGDKDGVNTVSEQRKRISGEAVKLIRQSSDSNLKISRVNALKKSVTQQHDGVAQILLGSKETVERKKLIEAAFRVCKEAFLEVAALYLGTIENRSSEINLEAKVKNSVLETLTEFV